MEQFRNIALGLLLFSGAGSCLADNPPAPQKNAENLTELSLEELAQIEVTTASKEPESAFRTPAAIYVLTQDDIRRSGATSIPEALRLVPGVEVARIDGSKWAIGIRGFGSSLSRSVLVLIDGRTVYTPLFAGTYWDVQDTLLEDIDRIEVIRGPGGTVWGPNAVNGVINIITKSSRDTHGALASAGGGNQEQGFANFRYGGGSADGFNYRIYGKGFTRGPEFHPDGDNFDDWRAARAGFRADWKHGEQDNFTVQGDIYTEEAGQRVTLTSYTPPFSQTIDANADLSGGNVLGRWEHGDPNGRNIQIQAYYDRTNRHEADYGELRDTFDVDFLQHAPLLKRHQVSWGLGARFSRGNFLPVEAGLVFNPAERTDQLLTGFLQDEIALIDKRLSVTLGTKVLHTNYESFQVEPSARLLWTPSAKQTFWAAFTHAVRTPSRVERDLTLLPFLGTVRGAAFFGRVDANPDFQSEQLNGNEIGYRRLLGSKISLDLTAFYNHYHDLLGLEQTGPAFIEVNPAPPHIILPVELGNGLLGTTKGVEIAPEWRPTHFWRLRASYSYLIMHLEQAPGSFNGGTAPGIEGSSPRHEVTIQSGLDLPKRLEFNQTLRYVSALPGQSVPGYTTGDLRFSWHRSDQWEFSVVGQNLFQPEHPEFGGDPNTLVGIVRSVYAKVTWRH